MDISTKQLLLTCMTLDPTLEIEELVVRFQNSTVRLNNFLGIKPAKILKIAEPEGFPPGFVESIRSVYLDEGPIRKTAAQINREVFSDFYPLQTLGRHLHKRNFPGLSHYKSISGVCQYYFDFSH